MLANRRKKKKAWVAVVEVIEDNLPTQRLLILVELFFDRFLAFCDTFMSLCTRSKQFHPPFYLYLSLGTLVSGKLIFLESQ